MGKFLGSFPGAPIGIQRKERDFHARSIAEVPIAHHACVNYQPQLPPLIICSFLAGRGGVFFSFIKLNAPFLSATYFAMKKLPLACGNYFYRRISCGNYFY